MDEINSLIFYVALLCSISYLIVRYVRYGFFLMCLCLIGLSIIGYFVLEIPSFLKILMYITIPFLFLNILLYVFFSKDDTSNKKNKKYKVVLNTKGSRYVLENIRRGVSIIGAAGSGKTESVVYNFLQHFGKNAFCGVMHDYKDFEITEMAYPIFKKSSNNFYIVSFDPIYDRVNPIAPRYLPDEESVYEISRVLLENLLELKESDNNSTSRFFKDAVEGLIGGLIWRLKTDYEDYCTIPHLIALYQHLETKALIAFLEADLTAKAMADAFISGVGSDRQTAGVKSTLANAFKKISTKKIFMVLSADDIPLDVNNPQNPAVISIVNNPKKEASLSPVIATIMHTITKQMSERGQNPSFVLLEEASTIRLLNMHRIPATLRGYDIVTLYVLQDKIQNDMMYGDRASRAILSNLSYQFFGKANDPDTAKYYERFFEIVKKETRSINKGYNLNFDTRVTHGEKEVAKTRADAFYRLRQGEFIVFADGKDKRLRFKTPSIKLGLPTIKKINDTDFDANFLKIHSEVKSIFK
ncbi:type IV secretory system conjugative DNA transfer family protein [Aureibaculum sp. 2210JD6-5]|uniref:type IV secretory system conjugative DNA transfer family protein n=1 Tax=Aureibaculum sp. 2210JD6-5 TaxID=3103957 RepID=UPI002AAD9A17|nr:type IV secretory system conjugative DNA transfer family protein [Aureibaculum sp. 2210JD6-5]MDY7396854.1 type IV secretory system conjugative DNA transfer family protein [Aureibaculum sp. 2210JD6-5]